MNSFKNGALIALAAGRLDSDAADRRITSKLSKNTMLGQGEALEELPVSELVDRLKREILRA